MTSDNYNASDVAWRRENFFQSKIIFFQNATATCGVVSFFPTL
jgi:hypothetical protein